MLSTERTLASRMQSPHGFLLTDRFHRAAGSPSWSVRLHGRRVRSTMRAVRSLPTMVAIASAPGTMPRGLVRLPFTDGTIPRSCGPIIHAPRRIRFSIS
jgi:hypothetical protein